MCRISYILALCFFFLQRMNNIQFNPSALLYQPVDAGVTVRYSLTSSRPEKSYRVRVTSDTISGVSLMLP